MSKHFTKKSARRRANRENNKKPKGRSSGWKRFDYGVFPCNGILRKYEVRSR